MKKILLLQEGILKYRVPVFERLAKKYDFTVAYTKKKYAPGEVGFKTLFLPETKLGPFIWINGLRKKCEDYDVVIYMPNLHFLSYCLIPVLPHNYKTISFSIGFRASYSKHYNLHKKKNIIDRLYGFFVFKGDAVLVYFKEVLSFWKKDNNIENKCFETRNTVEVKPIEGFNEKKDSILFVGTLYPQKKVDVLIRNYYEVISSTTLINYPILKIVGGGALLGELKALVKELNIEDKVHFTGPIYDEKELARLFAKAIVCVSPDQAGLSVPHSLGYGVPFVTTESAITGGEILHIKNGENGVLMHNIKDLPAVLRDVLVNPDKYIQMGKNAKIYYESSATVEIMVKGFDDAIQYAISH